MDEMKLSSRSWILCKNPSPLEKMQSGCKECVV